MPTLTGCSVCFKRALAIAKSFSRGSASIAIAAEFFWVSVMVVFMVACGLQKIYTVLQRTSTSDLGAHYLLSARSTSGISPCWRAVRGCLKSPANSNFTESAIRLHPSCPEAGVTTYYTQRFDGSQDFSNTLSEWDLPCGTILLALPFRTDLPSGSQPHGTVQAVGLPFAPGLSYLSPALPSPFPLNKYSLRTC
jgi:hypothetical protein